MRVMRQNLWWSALYNGLAIPRRGFRLDHAVGGLGGHVAELFARRAQCFAFAEATAACDVGCAKCRHNGTHLKG